MATFRWTKRGFCMLWVAALLLSAFLPILSCSDDTLQFPFVTESAAGVSIQGREVANCLHFVPGGTLQPISYFGCLLDFVACICAVVTEAQPLSHFHVQYKDSWWFIDKSFVLRIFHSVLEINCIFCHTGAGSSCSFGLHNRNWDCRLKSP